MKRNISYNNDDERSRLSFCKFLISNKNTNFKFTSPKSAARKSLLHESLSSVATMLVQDYELRFRVFQCPKEMRSLDSTERVELQMALSDSEATTAL